EQERLIKKILKIFPFMKEIHRSQSERLWKNEKRNLSSGEFWDIFEHYAKYLFAWRNYYSHSEHNKPDVSEYNKEISIFTCIVYDASVNIMKQRFYSKTDEKSFNSTFRRLNGLQKETKKPKENPSCLFQLLEKDQNGNLLPSEEGRNYILSFFLGKKYVSEMIDHLLPAESEQKIACKRLCIIHAALPPQPRLECGDSLTPQTLGMDILNHLHKVPRDLFDLMSPKIQNHFRILSDDKLTESLMRRAKKDRFPELALSYLDLKGKFKNIRFMINMGMYYYRCYPKKNLVDGSDLEERRIGQLLFAFERIQTAREQWIKDRESSDESPSLYWMPKPDQTPPEVYRVDMEPKYYIKENTIGISLRGSASAFPEIQKGQKVRNASPDCWLSIYELPMMLFLVCKGDPNAVENLIKEYCAGWNLLLNDIIAQKEIPADSLFKDKYKLDLRDLPDDLSNYIKTGKRKVKQPSPDDLVKKRAGILRERAEHTLLALKNENENNEIFKPGKKRVRRFTAGKIAMILTRELVQYQKSNANKPHMGKITSPNFMALQSALALFNENKDSIERIFIKAKLYNNPKYSHPFLYRVLAKKNNNLYDFFRIYLECKISYLKDAENDGGKDVHIFRHYYANALRKSDPEDIARYAEELRKSGFCLPRNLFKDLIEKKVRGECPDALKKEEEVAEKKGRKLNSSYLMMIWHREKRKDAFQWFYDDQYRDPAHTGEFETLFNITGTEPLRDQKASRKKIQTASEKELFPALQSWNRRKNENEINAKRESLYRSLETLAEKEKDIRFSRTEDIALILTVSDLLADLNQDSLLLKEIKQGNHLLDQTVQFSLPFLIPKDQDNPAFQCKIIGEMKLKNFGNYHRLVNDLRTSSLMRALYITSGKTEITVDELEGEFQKYDHAREKIFELVLELERAVLSTPEGEKLKNRPDTLKIGYIHFSTICNILSIPDYKKRIILLTRNAFAHHHYNVFTVDPKLDEKEKNYLNHKIKDDLIAKFDPSEPAVAQNILILTEKIFRETIDSIKGQNISKK
ncbi:MAG: type VI-B CRISPR-associated RNA-guided ribonuclease Cas13b, partial [Planctomycetia bacterium]|nr:type VI-B CRISPR-associated RNA-guided ribonuclease Cas13b [Planctomycetia bacterium]